MRALFALFDRSLREDMRAKLPPILRAALVLVILLIIFANERDFARRTAPGREFLLMAVMANLGLLVIATLGIFSSAITEEKEDQTLTLLRMTRLSPLAILLGKGTSRFVAAVLLLAVQIPFTLLAVALGGVSRDQIFATYAILGATTFLLCNLALLCSTVCRTTVRAGVWTGVIGTLIFFGLPIVCTFTALRRMSPSLSEATTLWENFSVVVVKGNPVYALVMLLLDRSSGSPVASNVVIQTIAGVVCFLLAWLVFDRCNAAAGEVVAKSRRARTGGLFKAWRTRSRPSVPRPLAWKEFHFLIGGWRWLFLRVLMCAGIVAAAYLFSAADRGWDPNPIRVWRDTGEISMALAACLFGLELALLASRIFGDERRNLTLGTLATLPKSTGWLIRQKIAGTWPVLLPSVLLFGAGWWIYYEASVALGYTALGTMRSDEWTAAFYILSHALLLPALIAWLSLKMRRGAMPAGIGIAAMLNVVIFVIADSAFRGSDEEAFIAIAAAGCIVLALVLARRIWRAIPAAAAAE